MTKNSYNDLLAFLAVAREQSFTRAAAQLGVSQSALSHLIRALEARMGVRLLTRTTRSVSLTEAGERLMRNIAPRFQEITAELEAVRELRDQPAGTIRITATENAAETVLWPRLAQVLPRHPLIKVEITAESRFVDLVEERYDMGVRLGDSLGRDMTSVRIGPDIRFTIVGSPAYLAQHPPPRRPQDLVDHDCINLRLMSHGELYAWELKKGKHAINVRVEGQLVFNRTAPILQAALAGFGLAYIPHEMAQSFLATGQLKAVLQDWGATFPGYYLYYPSRRQLSRAMSVLIDALRYPAQEH
ncbi:LysR family transcriptional regulator [Advenella mimigardefordensis]|uniref:Transcriptional regulator, LysR family n=1 Tax=Advenella mimigardefordensis (strain DSM 17166 / LMG 22922 / DPN7) TaxID=1247726 RepID=W0P9D0_ADVMD|nr:LysR family transcriptional regulator [Advenella mimigardefordensis]AHG63459.1 transcriptional regulator, LysR family [Advenella mimigardefordensis DPN7]